MRRFDRPASSIVSSAAMLAACLLIPSTAPAGAGSSSPVPAAASPTAASRAAAVPLTAAQALDRLKALAGTWEGDAEDGSGGGKATVVYRVIARGSVVMETLFAGSDHEMVSLYSVAGNELQMVHYCSIGNQPHFRLDRAASTFDRMQFVLDGGTGFDPKTDAHIHGGRITLKGADAMEAAWDYYQGGKSQGQKVLVLARTASASAAAAMR